jgi:hypothetical protein
MDWMIFGLIVVWLGIISWFDIRKSEIPHSAWVVIPLIGAGVFRVWQGGWVLVLLTIFVVVVSERERISILFQMDQLGRITTWLPLLFLGVFFAVQLSPIAILAIIGFWVAWELKWWGGADATAAITLTLIYPELAFIIAFLGAHIFVTTGLAIRSLIMEKSIKLHKIPGLPLLFLTVLSFKFIYPFFLPFCR